MGMTIQRISELLEIERECVFRNACGECNRFCAECDLLQDGTELHEMYTDVIALLKAQEPRVMTLEEVINSNDPIYIEQTEHDGKWCVVLKRSVEGYYKGPFDKVTLFMGVDGYLPFITSEYNKTWRCWTSRPTDEQREAIPWQ